MLNKIIATSALTLVTFAQAQAVDFSFSGNIVNHNDVVQIAFTLATDVTNVSVWTDSFQDGANFDPITAVWSEFGSDWALVGERDDNPYIAPGQTSFDSGLQFATLNAGNYLFTIAQYSNFAEGTLLSQGFLLDSEVPIALLGGTFYSVHLSDSIAPPPPPPPPVPEPETYAMLLAGLGLMGFSARRRKESAV
jgi:hypothetical protein